MELEELAEGELAYNIAVEHEEGFGGRPGEQFLAGESDSSCGAEKFGLDGGCDSYVELRRDDIACAGTSWASSLRYGSMRSGLEG